MRLRSTDLIVVALAALVLGGCSSGGELPKEQDQALREGFRRTMSEEEVARLKGQTQTGGGNQAAPEGASTAPSSGPTAD